MLYQTKNPHGGDVYGEPIQYDFSANTNPFGIPQSVLDAMQNVLTEVYHYPDPYCRKLVEAISQREQVPKEYILCGNGAAELIYSYCQAVKPRKAAELAPTFSEYALGLERVGCQVVRYNLKQKENFVLDDGILDFLKAEAPDTLFLCNPNNPTGATIPQKLLEQLVSLCKEKNIRLFVDECFLDLSDQGESLKSLLKENPHLFLLKAFTKNYGMAGVRLGYCLSADAALLSEMAAAVQPWNVSTLAQAAGAAAMGEEAFLERTKAFIPGERQWLRTQLEALGLWVCPSSANYLLFHGRDGLREALLRTRIAIRSCENYHGLGTGWYRVAVKLREENEALVRALGLALGKESSWQSVL